MKTNRKEWRVGELLKIALVNNTPLSRSKEEVENQPIRLLSISEKLL